MGEVSGIVEDMLKDGSRGTIILMLDTVDACVDEDRLRGFLQALFIYPHLKLVTTGGKLLFEERKPYKAAERTGTRLYPSRMRRIREIWRLLSPRNCTS